MAVFLATICITLCLSVVSWSKEYKLGYLTGQRIRNLKFAHNGAAPYMAVAKAKADGILGPNDTIRILYRDDEFDPTLSMGYSIEMYEEIGVDGFVGLSSAAVASMTGYLMSHWNLPAFSQLATDPDIEDKSAYTTLLPLAPAFEKVGDLFVELMMYYGWKRIAIFFRKSILCEYSSLAMYRSLSGMGVLISSFFGFETGLNEEDLNEIVEDIRTKSRVISFCGNEAEKVRFMLRMRAENLTGAEYVYIMAPYRPMDGIYQPWLDDSNSDKEKLLEASHAFLQTTLVALDKTEFDNFSKEHIAKMEDIWNFTDHKNWTSVYALLLHDATYLYLLALNKTLEDGGDPRNGSHFAKVARELTFQGASGLVAFDVNGERQPTCSVWYTRPGRRPSIKFANIVLSNRPGERIDISEDIIWRTSDGSVPPDSPPCGFSGELCIKHSDNTLVVVLIIVLVASFSAFGIACAFLYIRKRNLKRKLREFLWKVDFTEVSVVNREKFGRSWASLKFELTGNATTARSSSYVLSNQRSTSVGSSFDDLDNGQIFTKVAMYKGQLVAVKFAQNVVTDYEHKEEMNIMCELSHENINKFVGACVDPDNTSILTVYCQKGSLQDILENDSIQLDSIFKESLILDLVNGMLYLHSSPLRSHGNLKSSNCVIDSRWVLKITDFHPSYFTHRTSGTTSEYEIYRALLWTAPEMLRAQDRGYRGSPSGDVFSFGIILQEILYRALPYFMDDFSPKEIISRVKTTQAVPFRPICPVSTDVKGEFMELMKQCWEENPKNRPAFSQIKRSLGVFSDRGKVNIMDRMIQKLESYSNNLEDIVRNRTVALREEKQKTDSLLYQMLPSVVADKLKQGEHIPPELYEQATVYFSDILGFVEIAAESSPLEVVVLLNDLYEMLDNLVAGYDIYKVETIGDSYMVVSGIPVRNGNRHVAEIADMSLKALEEARVFKIRHRPSDVIQLRVGFHTGRCCAGVVGLTMPRYCLFGDTVNTASRMESNGEALKIHISEQSYLALSSFGYYNMVERGRTVIKGKGQLTTYWLEGKI